MTTLVASRQEIENEVATEPVEVVTATRPVYLPVIEPLTRTVSCSQCGQEFPFGTAQQAATRGQHGFSHCQKHVEALKENRNYCATTLSHEEFAALDLTVPPTFMRELADGVAISVPQNCYVILKEIVAGMRQVEAELAGPEMRPANGAQEFYGKGRRNGD